MAKEFSLVIIKGENVGEEFTFNEDKVKIGSEPQKNNIILEDSDISREHAAIYFNKGQFFLEHIDNSNKTIHNGKTIKAKEKVNLRSKDTLKIGNSSFVFLCEDTGASKVYLLKDGERHDFEQEKIKIGRSAGKNDIVINEDAVSREHTEIILRGGKFFLKDLNSSNKTYLGGKPLDKDEIALLKNGDKFTLGKNIIFLFYDKEDDDDSNKTVQFSDDLRTMQVDEDESDKTMMMSTPKIDTSALPSEEVNSKKVLFAGIGILVLVLVAVIVIFLLKNKCNEDELKKLIESADKIYSSGNIYDAYKSYNDAISKMEASCNSANIFTTLKEKSLKIQEELNSKYNKSMNDYQNSMKYKDYKQANIFLQQIITLIPDVYDHRNKETQHLLKKLGQLLDTNKK